MNKKGAGGIIAVIVIVVIVAAALVFWLIRTGSYYGNPSSTNMMNNNNMIRPNISQTPPNQTQNLPDNAVPSDQKSDVVIKNFSFTPQTLTVKSGATVTWTNSDSATHTVTSDNNTFNSGNLAPGNNFQFTFSSPGTYTYHCSIHPSMTGKIIVQ